MRFLSFKKFIFYYAPLFAWSGLIFYFSSVAGSGYESYDIVVFLERKGAHLFEYFILAFLWARVFWMHNKDENNNAYYWAIFTSFVFAISDEIHQIFVFGRSGKATDVLIDFIGVLIGVYAYYYIHKKRKLKAIEYNKKKSR